MSDFDFDNQKQNKHGTIDRKLRINGKTFHQVAIL